MKKLFYLATIILYLCGCSSKNTESKVIDVIENHPDAHSILFFNPSTTIIAEGDGTKELQRLDYIAFSVGYVRVKFLGKEEQTLQLEDEPSFSTRAAMFYIPKDKNISFSINLGGATFFYEKDGEFIVSNYTKTHQMKMEEYINIIQNKNMNTPPVLTKLMEAAKFKDDGYHPFDY